MDITSYPKVERKHFGVKTWISTGAWRGGGRCGGTGVGGGAEKERKDMLRADEVEVV